jgi:hypothetical protein
MRLLDLVDALQVVGVLVCLTVTPALLMSLRRPVGISRAAGLTVFGLGALVSVAPALAARLAGG